MRWLTRLVSRTLSREVRNLKVRLDAAHAGHRDALRLYGRKCEETNRLRADVVVAAERLSDELRETTDAILRTDRYRLSWLSASRRAQRRAEEIQALQRVAESKQRIFVGVERTWAERVDVLKVSLREAQAEVAARAVAPLSGAALDLPDRTALYRLEEENARLRAENETLRTKLGVTP